MLRLIRPAAVAALACAVVANAADKTDLAPAEKAAIDAKILSEIKDRSQIMKNLAYLSDVIGPRLTGSAGLERANRWTKAKMEEYGLTNVQLEPWEIPIGWERGKATVTMIEPRTKTLTVASAGWAPGTKGKVSGEVVVLDVRTKADLEKYKGKLKNAVIIQRPPTNIAPVAGADPRYGAPGGSRPEPAAGGRRPGGDAPPAGEKKDAEKKDDAKKTDAKAPEQPPRERGGFGDLLGVQRELGEFLKAEGAAATLTDSGKPHGLLVTTGGWSRGDRGTQTEGVARLYMAHEDYALLYRLATEHKVTPKVEIEVTNTFVPGPVTVYNTVGEVRGSEKPDEFVVVGAHIDSWDLATGTTDNGTGTCVVLEAARTVAALAKAGHPPKRTIRFALFSGEEQGLHGSREYVKRHDAEMPKTSLAIVHDTGTGKVYGFGLLGRLAAGEMLTPELSALKDVGFTGLSPRGMSGGTDHASFNAKGVPGFAAQQDSDEYRFTHHTQSDTFDKAKEPNLIQGAQVMALTAVRVANLPALLPRATGEPKKDDAKKPDEKK